MTFQKLLGFAPDLDPTTEGIVKTGTGLVPTRRGLGAAPSPENTDLAEITATAIGGATIMKGDGTTRTFAVTPGEILEGSGTTWTDRSSSAYTATVARFAQLRDQTFAALGLSDTIQQSSTGAFAALTSAPAAKIVEVVTDQVFALNTSDDTYGAEPDRWRVSAFELPGSWTANISTLAASGRLTATAGDITAGKRLGSNLVVYKGSSLYLGTFVGAPAIWRFDLVTDEIGALTQEGVIAAENVHFFAGQENFYVFDGTRPIPIGDDIKDFFFDGELNFNFRASIRGVYDREAARLVYFYPSSASTTGELDKRIEYNIRTGKWGTPTVLDVRAPFEYRPTTGPTYDTLGDSYATYDDLPTIAYNSPFWFTVANRVAVFNTSNKLQNLTGTGVATDFTPWTMGDDRQLSFITRVRPRFNTYPTSGELVNSYADNLGDTFTSASGTAALNDGKFDFEREARWHSFRMETVGDMEILGLDVEGLPAGTE